MLCVQLGRPDGVTLCGQMNNAGHMAKLNITQAAKAAGISRNTLYAHIRSGKISCEKDKSGNKSIDISELQRVYGSIEHRRTLKSRPSSGSIQQLDTPEIERFFREQIGILERQVEELRRDKEVSQDREEKMLTMLKDEQEKNKTLLLTLQPEEKRKTLWERLFG